MRVMQPMRRLAAMRRASVAVILGLLVTVAACATAAPQGHSPAAASRGHHRAAAPKCGPREAALTAAAQAAEAGAGGTVMPGTATAAGYRVFRPWACLLPHAAAGRGAAVGRPVRPMGAGQPDRGEQGRQPPLQPDHGRAGRAGFLAGDDPQADQLIAPRINGDFTGTTAEILRWAACKWGIDQDIVFAQAAVESWWRQATLGDWDDATAARPGTAPASTASPASARRARASCRTGTPTSSRAGRASATRPR